MAALYIITNIPGIVRVNWILCVRCYKLSLFGTVSAKIAPRINNYVIWLLMFKMNGLYVMTHAFLNIIIRSCQEIS